MNFFSVVYVDIKFYSLKLVKFDRKINLFLQNSKQISKEKNIKISSLFSKDFVQRKVLDFNIRWWWWWTCRWLVKDPSHNHKNRNNKNSISFIMRLSLPLVNKRFKATVFFIFRTLSIFCIYKNTHNKKKNETHRIFN